MTEAVVVRRGRGWVVAWKPAGALFDADPAREPDTVRAALAAALGVPFRTCHPHTRLDQPVAGLSLWSIDSATRRSFVEATRRGAIRKLYLALAASAPSTRVLRLPAERPAWRTRAGRPLPDVPETRIAVLAARGGTVLVAAGITAGKWHQIRLHFASTGAPLIGDRLHGGPARVVREDGAVLAAPAVALEAVAIEFQDGGTAARVLAAPRSFVREAALWVGLPEGAVDTKGVERAWTEVWGEGDSPL
jgi:23S rRNA-/tRNA-specific pseudouridylate synthase